MNILVTGANGQLGNEIRKVCRRTAHRYVFTDVVEQPGVDTELLDITDMDAVRRIVAENDIDVIVNCAAYTNVDKAEEDIDSCALLNVMAPGNLAAVMRETGGLLVHISTDYVFDGESRDVPYTEQDATGPACVYGSTKLEGEIAVADSGCKYVIVRTSWLYSEYGKNFVKTMMSMTSTKQHLNVVSDQVGTPTWALDLADAILTVLEDYSSEQNGTGYGKNGVYHYSNEGMCSWYDFAKTIAEYAGNLSCEITPCRSDEFPSKVKRPSYSVLDKTKIKETFGIDIPCWKDSLLKCIDNLK